MVLLFYFFSACPKLLNLPSWTLFPDHWTSTWAVLLIYSFLILSIVVTPKASVTPACPPVFFLFYVTAGLTTILNLHFQLRCHLSLHSDCMLKAFLTLRCKKIPTTAAVVGAIYSKLNLPAQFIDGWPLVFKLVDLHYLFFLQLHCHTSLLPLQVTLWSVNITVCGTSRLICHPVYYQSSAHHYCCSILCKNTLQTLMLCFQLGCYCSLLQLLLYWVEIKGRIMSLKNNPLLWL